MEPMGWVAIVGAAAWVPQIITWLYRAFTKAKVSIYLDKYPQVGFSSFGPIFNVNLALLSGKKDIIFNKLTIKLKHESNALYTFEWDGLSEALSEIENPIGTNVMIKKTYLPLAIKVLHTGVAQAFVRFQHRQFKINQKEPYAEALARVNLLKSSGSLNTEEQIEDLVSLPEFDRLMQLFSTEFIWAAGKYTVTFEFGSPNKFKYKKKEYTFRLLQSDIDNLRTNIDNIRNYMIQSVKQDTIPDYQFAEIFWKWVYPELKEDN